MGNQSSAEGGGIETKGPVEDEPMPLKDEVDRRFEELLVSCILCTILTPVRNPIDYN